MVTGAGGNLGRAAIPALVEAGHVPRLMDFRSVESEHEVVRGDVRSHNDVRRAMDGCDAVVHAAAIHGIHLRNWEPHDFWSIDATGTFTVFEATREAGIERVVLASTMGVYGESSRPSRDAWAVVTEESPTLPTDVYGMTKLLCEEVARYYWRVHGITTVALRLGMFVPAGFEHYGFRLLFGGVDERDVAQAVVLSLAHDPEGGFDVVDVMADTPFELDDAEHLLRDALGALERNWPGCSELFRERALDLEELIWGRAMWPINKAKRTLGFRPRWNFGEFLKALREDRRDRYPFLDLGHWGRDLPSSGLPTVQPSYSRRLTADRVRRRQDPQKSPDKGPAL